MIRPLPNSLILEPIPVSPSHSLRIEIPERYRSDEKLFVVVACGRSVPFDIQPGNHVLLDRHIQNPDEFEHAGRRLMVTGWKSVAAVIVRGEQNPATAFSTTEDNEPA